MDDAHPIWPRKGPALHRRQDEGKGRALGNVPNHAVLAPEIPIDDFRKEDIICHKSLGGLLRHYVWKAA